MIHIIAVNSQVHILEVPSLTVPYRFICCAISINEKDSSPLTSILMTERMLCNCTLMCLHGHIASETEVMRNEELK